jgi:hypothetical protein
MSGAGASGGASSRRPVARTSWTLQMPSREHHASALGRGHLLVGLSGRFGAALRLCQYGRRGWGWNGSRGPAPGGRRLVSPMASRGSSASSCEAEGCDRLGSFRRAAPGAAWFSVVAGSRSLGRPDGLSRDDAAPAGPDPPWTGGRAGRGVELGSFCRAASGATGSSVVARSRSLGRLDGLSRDGAAPGASSFRKGAGAPGTGASSPRDGRFCNACSSWISLRNWLVRVVS